MNAQSSPALGTFDHLREHSIGLPQALFQSITHMAPGAAIAFSILGCSSTSGALRSRTRSSFLSVACDAGIAQACKPAPHFGTIARFSIPKIDATPAPFFA
jgi:hypothetical protein